jgi:hypothetical protein
MTNSSQRQQEHLFIGYIITLCFAVVCNLGILFSIVRLPMRSPNIRLIFLLTVALILGEIFGLPDSYNYHHTLCAAAGSLKAYFEIMVVCTSLVMSLLAYLQIFGCV